MKKMDKPKKISAYPLIVRKKRIHLQNNVKHEGLYFENIPIR